MPPFSKEERMIPLGTKVYDTRRPMIRGRLVSVGDKLARIRLANGMDHKLALKHVQPIAWVAVEKWHKQRRDA